MKKSNNSKKNSVPKSKIAKRISKKEYNKEIDEAVARIEKGNSVTHKSALKELSKW